jgi:hypothetical protein
MRFVLVALAPLLACSSGAMAPPPRKLAASDPNAHRRSSDLQRKDLGNTDLTIAEWPLGRPESPPAPPPGLSPDQTAATVRSHTITVRRKCWDLLDAGGASRSLTTVHMNIDDSGTVSSAQADGDNDAVARCLENEVKSWTFPGDGGVTQLSLPFRFSRQ